MPPRRWKRLFASMVPTAGHRVRPTRSPRRLAVEGLEDRLVLSGLTLVADLNPQANSSQPAELTVFDNAIYFSATDGLGTELWRTEGTAATTHQVADLRPGVAGSNPVSLMATDDALYFVASNLANSSDRSLFRLPVGSSTPVRVAGGYSNVVTTTDFNPVAVGGAVYFYGQASSNSDSELWRGDANGAVRVKDIRVGGNSTIRYLTAAGSRVFFSATDNGSDYELWVSDGTEAGTTKLEINTAGSAAPDNLVYVPEQDVVYFAGTGTAGGRELWKSDGTPGGTVQVADIRTTGNGSSSPTSLAYDPTSRKLFFSAAGDEGGGLLGSELHTYDTVTGTVTLVKDINPGQGSSQAGSFTRVGGAVYFVAEDNSYGRELWKTDGTEAGTVRLTDIYAGGLSSSPQQLTPLNGNLLFTAFHSGFSANSGTGRELYRVDAATGAAALVKDINTATSPFNSAGTADSNPTFLTVYGGAVYFRATTGSSVTASGPEAELWASDGTAANTTQVVDIFPGTAGSNPTELTAVGGTLYFAASDLASGNELRKTEPSGGISLVKNIAFVSNPSNPTGLTAVNDTLYFAAFSDSSGAGGDIGTELWKSNGTAATTILVKDIRGGFEASSPDQLTAVGDKLYFVARGNFGRELHVSDGTAGGTFQVLDANSSSTDSGVANITPAGGNAYYFTAYPGGGSTYYLYYGDGTSAPQWLLNTPNQVTNPTYLTVFNNKLYFTGRYNGFNSNYDFELFESDGTAAGTKLLKDIYPGTTINGPNQGSPQGLTVHNNALYFTAYSANGFGLWTSDGTGAGTVQVKLLVPTAGNGGLVQRFTQVGDKLFFTVRDNNDTELWVTDGTDTGTYRVKDINPTGSSSPTNLTAVGDKLYFTAFHPDTGAELWVSDGTEAGTSLVEDLYVGPIGSNPTGLTNLGGTLYLAATRPDVGAELWSLAPPPSGVALSTAGVAENAPAGTVVGTVSASGATAYALVAGDGDADNASFTLDPGGSLRATTSFNYEARSTYSVRVRATGPGGAAEQAFTVVVIDVDEAPVARPDRVIVPSDAAGTPIAYFANDYDPDGNPFIYNSFTQPAHGTVTTQLLDGDFVFVYTPAPGFTGEDSFTYTLREIGGTLTSTPATVTLSVSGTTAVQVNAYSQTLGTDLQGAVATAAAAAEPTPVVLNVNAETIGRTLTALAAMPAASAPVDVVLYFNIDTYHGLTINAPANVHVVLDGGGGQVTLTGASPALTVTAGEVVVRNGVTFVNPTDAPTILVTGGRLLLRNSAVTETPGGNQPAILVTGGVVDLGTAADPGGNTFRLTGAGLFIRNEAAADIQAIGNLFIDADGIALDPAQPAAIDAFIVDNLDDLAVGKVVLVAPADTVPPETSVTSGPPTASTESTADFTFAATDNVTAPGGVTFHYRLDGGLWIATGPTLTLTGLANGPHTLEVKATDGAGNEDQTQAVHTWTISTVPAPTVTGFEVAGNTTQRSYIRTLAITLDRPEALGDLIERGGVRLVNRGLDGTRNDEVSLTGFLSVSDGRLLFNFGAQGLGGNRNSNLADGLYEVQLDLDNDGVFETIRSFHRLFGDVNGDGTVNAADFNLILAAYGTTDPERDVNGDGVVNAMDRTLAIRNNGRSIRIP